MRLTAVPVDPDIARRLRRVRDRMTAALEERDRLIVQAIEAGGSLREVGALAGLTHAGVKDVLRRKQAAARSEAAP